MRKENLNRNTTTGNNRRHRRHKSVSSQLTRTCYVVDGGSLEVVTGPIKNVKGYLQRTRDKLNVSAIGLSTMLKPVIVSAIVFKSDKGGIFSAKTLIPDSIMNEVFQAATLYRGVPVKMAWLRLFGDLGHKIRTLSFDSNIFNLATFKDDTVRDRFTPMAVEFTRTYGFLFKGGLINGHLDTNSLVLTAPYNPDTRRQTYVDNGTNFAPLPIVTDQPICQSVFGKNLLLQAERNGHTVFGLTSQSIAGFLNYKVGQVNWTKLGAIKNPIIELSSIPVQGGTMIITTGSKGKHNFELARVGWEGNKPAMFIDHQIEGFNLDPVIRTDQSGIVTYQADHDQVTIYPIDQIDPKLASFIATSPVTPTPPSVM